MNLLQLKNIHLAYGPRVLLEDANLAVEAGDCIGLLGRNGEGKSSLLKMLAGEYQPDEGEILYNETTRIAWLPQELPVKSEDTAYQFIASGHPELAEKLIAWKVATESNEMAGLAQLQEQIEALDGWLFDQKVYAWLTEFFMPADQKLSSLSGGWLRRLALARALVREPDILLLDEPTNHLDIEAIEWLETLVQRFNGAVILITHDRRFLQSVCNRILELDRGQLIDWRGDYQGFLSFREQRLHAEEKQRAEFDKKLAAEETWIRQGIKARRTRNEGRVRALKAMRETYRQRRHKQGVVKAEIEQGDASGKLVAEVKNIAYSWPGKTVLEDFSITVQRGDRLALLGPNGVGKTTVLKLLLGELEPQSGKVRLGVNRQIAYFDQHRAILDPGKTVIDNVSGGRDFIEINGRKRHIISYLQDFLFLPDRCRQPVKSLSGGEQNRLMLASLFSKPANILVLDEPTNDLDLETLELLEELLMEFTGTVLLVSHDRDFVDNVVTRSLVMAGDGEIEEVIGGYSEAEPVLHRRVKAMNSPNSVSRKEPQTNKAENSVKAESKPIQKVKLSYKLQRELDDLPQDIEKLEEEIGKFEKETSDASFYQKDPAAAQKSLENLASMQAELESKMERWVELEQMAQGEG